MARTRRIKRDGDAHYHLMSRTNDRRFLFSKGRVKGEIVSLLRRAAAFSGVRLEAWCVMDNHFHIVCEVVKPDEPVSEDDVIRRIGILKGERFAAELAEHWSDLRSCGGYAFVMRAIFGFGDCFTGHPIPRPVFAGVSRGLSPVEAYASHGWRKAG